jgi:hypothetical protein
MKGGAVGDPWYSVEGHVVPFEGNAGFGRKCFVKLRLRNITIGHLKAAAGRISTIKVEAAPIPGRGMVVGLFASVKSLSEEEIKKIMLEVNMHLKHLTEDVGTLREEIVRRKTVAHHQALNKEEYINTPPWRH